MVSSPSSAATARPSPQGKATHRTRQHEQGKRRPYWQRCIRVLNDDHPLVGLERPEITGDPCHLEPLEQRRVDFLLGTQISLQRDQLGCDAALVRDDRLQLGDCPLQLVHLFF